MAVPYLLTSCMRDGGGGLGASPWISILGSDSLENDEGRDIGVGWGAAEVGDGDRTGE